MRDDNRLGERRERRAGPARDTSEHRPLLRHTVRDLTDKQARLRPAASGLTLPNGTYGWAGISVAAQQTVTDVSQQSAIRNSCLIGPTA